MTEETPALEFENFGLAFPRAGSEHVILQGADLAVPAGGFYLLAGESGSGKSVTCRAILRLLPGRGGRIAGGEVRYDGRNLLSLSEDEIRRVRGSAISMICLAWTSSSGSEIAPTPLIFREGMGAALDPQA